MPNSGVRASIEELAGIVSTAHQDVESARLLEGQAKELRRQAPETIDAAIGRAVSQLYADSRSGSLNPRETLEAVLDINQFKPSRVMWSGPPKTQKVLDAFDRLSEAGTPLIAPTDRKWSLYAGLTSKKPLGVKVVERVGMGGLPDAEVSFGSYEVTGDLEEPKVAGKQAIKKVNLHQLEDAAVGVKAIQRYLDSIELDTHDSTCGCGKRHYSDNQDELNAALNVAKLLAKAGNFSLDTDKIDEKLRISQLRFDAIAYERRRRREFLRGNDRRGMRRR